MMPIPNWWTEEDLAKLREMRANGDSTRFIAAYPIPQSRGEALETRAAAVLAVGGAPSSPF